MKSSIYWTFTGVDKIRISRGVSVSDNTPLVVVVLALIVLQCSYNPNPLIDETKVSEYKIY